MKFGNSHVSLIFIVVPKLIKECIIGYKMLIDTSREEIYMTINHSNENVSYKETTLDKDNFVALRIVYDEATEQTHQQSTTTSNHLSN